MADLKPEPPKPDNPNALAQFSVNVDGLRLGQFTGCEGLSAEYTIEEVLEGGNNSYVYKLPGRVKYTNVKLSRLLTSESGITAAWFSKYARGGQRRGQATITLFDEWGKAICRWELKEVHPVKWTGPNFSADGSGVAKETLELIHHGFDWKPA